jgi:hypothetical protein
VVSLLLLCGLAPHEGRAHEGSGGPEHHEGVSADDLAQKLANPVSNIWSLQLQNNMTFLSGRSIALLPRPVDDELPAGHATAPDGRLKPDRTARLQLHEHADGRFERRLRPDQRPRRATS